jgi:hypothetical protein
MDQMWVVSPSGEKFGGADAIRYLVETIAPAVADHADVASSILHASLEVPL